MKNIFTLLAAVLFTATNWAQSTPQKMNYQAVIRNSINELVVNHAVGMRISILQGSPTGTEVYTEIQTPTTNANGLVSIEIGGGAGFSSINWTNGPYFIKTETDPAGGTNWTITGTSQLLSVPYALQAKVAETAGDAVKLTGDQTIAGDKTFTGTTTVPTPVNATDAATKAYVDNLLEKIEYLESLVGVEEPVTDYDGNTYRTIRIGTQVWMAENLKTTTYRNGDLIGTTIPASLDISGEINPKYQWAYGGNESYVAIYGRLYTWYAVTDSRNVCPTGWHVPIDADWTTLTTYLGGESIAGGKLKETGTIHWNLPNTEATNETGFTALPGGHRYYIGLFNTIGNEGNWWSATENASSAWYRIMSYYTSDVLKNSNNKNYGFSVRCLRD